MRYKILIVDDDADHRKLLKLLLEKENFTVLVASDGPQGLMFALDSRPDLVVTDVAMPGTDGLNLCRRLKSDRRTAAIPVLLMSGKVIDEEKQIEGMEQGADDYLLKPFSPRLLKAKVDAVLRRYAAPADLKDLLRGEGLDLDVQARTASLKGKRIELTRKEFDLLTTFLRKPGQVLSVNYLLETVWGYDPADYNDPATLQVHISSLRRKLGAKLADKFVNVPGVGYRFESRRS